MKHVNDTSATKKSIKLFAELQTLHLRRRHLKREIAYYEFELPCWKNINAGLGRPKDSDTTRYFDGYLARLKSEQESVQANISKIAKSLQIPK